MMMLHVAVMSASFTCCVHHVIKKFNVQLRDHNSVYDAKRQVVWHRDSIVVYLLICLYSWVNLVLELMKLA